jgi:acyl CoA:acetate/3-ketoacid CoA transferase beta subunit
MIRTAKGDRHINGSGGGNDIASLAKRTIVIMPHEKRKISERVAFLTTPGFIDGGNTRKEAGLRGGGPSRVITDKAVMGFDEASKKMKVISIHPGVTREELVQNTGFPLIVPENVKTTAAPTREQLRWIREVIDSDGLYTGEKA